MARTALRLPPPASTLTDFRAHSMRTRTTGLSTRLLRSAWAFTHRFKSLNLKGARQGQAQARQSRRAREIPGYATARGRWERLCVRA
jgi:hypothetical protein